jgi:hypothetical protein
LFRKSRKAAIVGLRGYSRASAARVSSYDHLLTAAATNLRTVRCAFWDDIATEPSEGEIKDIVRQVFNEANDDPAFVDLFVLGSSKSRRISYSRFETESISSGVSVSVHAKTPNELEQTWNPPTFVKFRRGGRVNSIGLYTDTVCDPDALSDSSMFANLRHFNAAAAYRFDFPLMFSPSAYMADISFSPSRREAGKLCWRDKERVANYGNHCWRGERASDGFLRDIYDMIIFRDATAHRTVESLPLVDWIAQRPERGVVTACDDEFVWRPGTDKRYLQDKLDAARILLAGFVP